MPSVSFQASVSILTGLEIYYLCIWLLLDVYSLKGAKSQWHLQSMERPSGTSSPSPLCEARTGTRGPAPSDLHVEKGRGWGSGWAYSSTFSHG